MNTRFLPLLALLFSAGCATIAHGPNQKIEVVSNPPGALACASEHCVDTPGVLVIPRHAREIRIAVEKDGYVTRVFPLERTGSGLVWLNMAVIPAGIYAGASIGEQSSSGFGAFEAAYTGAAVGAVALVGVCMGADYISGAAFEQTPGRLVVDLARVEVPGTPGASDSR
jgi:hypothetical protein